MHTAHPVSVVLLFIVFSAFIGTNFSLLIYPRPLNEQTVLVPGITINRTARPLGTVAFASSKFSSSRMYVLISLGDLAPLTYYAIKCLIFCE